MAPAATKPDKRHRRLDPNSIVILNLFQNDNVFAAERNRL
jgi:hypothetical protein